jgi:membrane-bound serine protease (ClpP class)
VDVVTDGEYIDAGTPVVVTGVEGNRIIVDRAELKKNST